MSPMDRIRDRYLNDAAFHVVVDSLRKVITDLHLSPSEVREAAAYAAYLVELRSPSPIQIGMAPGDLCGSTKMITHGPNTGKPCPGCRACS